MDRPRPVSGPFSLPCHHLDVTVGDVAEQRRVRVLELAQELGTSRPPAERRVAMAGTGHASSGSTIVSGVCGGRSRSSTRPDVHPKSRLVGEPVHHRPDVAAVSRSHLTPDRPRHPPGTTGDDPGHARGVITRCRPASRTRSGAGVIRAMKVRCLNQERARPCHRAACGGWAPSREPFRLARDDVASAAVGPASRPAGMVVHLSRRGRV
jgi:hypothetical protein